MDASVLIVEDNDLNMRLFTDLLEGLGYEVLQALDAESALAILKTRSPGVIIMDIQLPDMSGIDCTRKIKSDPTLCHIPVIAVTAFAMDGDEAHFRQCGCDDYISKPISLDGLVSTIKKHVPLVS
jgi:two-component system cell cycle response regulator DivK